METVPEVPMSESRRSTYSGRAGSQQTPRHVYRQQSLDDPTRPSSSSASSGSSSRHIVIETPIIPDANSLKRKLHNLFLSGPSLRSRHTEATGGGGGCGGGSLGSAASASPVSTDSPMEWPAPVGDLLTPLTPPTSSSSSPFFPSDSASSYGRSMMGREISLEEELQARLANAEDAARAWQTKWRQEREDTCRLSDHLARCEVESKRLIENLSNGYTKKIKMLEDTLMRAMKSNEQLLLEKGHVEDRLRQSKEVIDLQRHEIEKEFARARQDVAQLRSEVGNMQSRTQRLEKENDTLKAEKQHLTNDLKLFTGNTKKFSTSMQETDVRCELYRALLDITLKKLKESDTGLERKKRAKASKINNGRFIMRVDVSNPTSMRVEDLLETKKAKEAKKEAPETKEVEAEFKSPSPVPPPPSTSAGRQLEIRPVSTPRTRYLPVVHTTTQLSVAQDNKMSQGSRSVSPLPWSSLNRNRSGVRAERTNHAKADRQASFSVEYPTPSTPNDDKYKGSDKKARRFSFGKDSKDKAKNFIKQLSGGGKPDLTTVVVAVSKMPSGDEGHSGSPRDNGQHPRASLENSFGRSSFSDDGEIVNLTNNSSISSPRRLRSLSDSEDGNLIRDETTTEFIDEQGNTFVDIQTTTYRSRSNTLDSIADTHRKHGLAGTKLSRSRDLSNSPSSSSEELRNKNVSGFEALRSRRNGIATLGSSPDTGASKPFMMRKYKTKDITDLLKVFTSDKDGSGKDQGKSNKKKGKFGK